MKRALILSLVLLALALPALAEGLPLVVDGADLLSSAEVGSLSAAAQNLSDEYGMDVVIVTTRSLGVKSARDYAADYYDEKGYGRGARHDGVMLLLATAERDWWILTTGRGIQAFTDYGIDVLSEDFLGYLKRDDYAGGFTRFLHGADIILRGYESGAPYDVNRPLRLRSPIERLVGALPVVALISAAIAGIALFILSRGMKTARPAYDADRYVSGGAISVSRSGDYFLYRTRTRVRRPKESSSSGSRGGSTTFTSSSGRTHGGGGGKY
ncbi:MAG: TPM domain-containing protein [Clostridiales bacterium]|nr:TPM domain-containing protein [Clostridiales bacterium]